MIKAHLPTIQSPLSKLNKLSPSFTFISFMSGPNSALCSSAVRFKFEREAAFLAGPLFGLNLLLRKLNIIDKYPSLNKLGGRNLICNYWQQDTSKSLTSAFIFVIKTRHDIVYLNIFKKCFCVLFCHFHIFKYINFVVKEYTFLMECVCHGRNFSPILEIFP